MTDQLDAHFRKSPEFYFDVRLDKGMADWDIKMLVEKYMACNSWSDLTEVDRGQHAICTTLQGSCRHGKKLFRRLTGLLSVGMGGGDMRLHVIKLGVLWSCLMGHTVLYGRPVD